MPMGRYREVHRACHNWNVELFDNNSHSISSHCCLVMGLHSKYAFHSVLIYFLALSVVTEHRSHAEFLRLLECSPGALTALCAYSESPVQSLYKCSIGVTCTISCDYFVVFSYGIVLKYQECNYLCTFPTWRTLKFMIIKLFKTKKLFKIDKSDFFHKF